MKKYYNYWQSIHYIACCIVAIWGFTLLYENGINSRGNVLLLMACIGLHHLVYLIYKKRMIGKNGFKD